VNKLDEKKIIENNQKMVEQHLIEQKSKQKKENLFY
jgi:hypothetical protein